MNRDRLKTLLFSTNSLFSNAYFSVVNTLASCQLCGADVRVNGSEAVCTSCGAEYDVIRHGRRGDFSKSVEVALNAQKIPTIFRANEVDLRDPATNTSIKGTTQYIGTKVRVWGILSVDKAGYPGLGGKTVRVMKKVGVGAYAEIAKVTTNPYGEAIYDDTLATEGSTTYQLIFDGDATYAGCPSTIHGLKVSGDYAVSPEVSLSAQPALTVIVKDILFKKPIEGAKVVIDTSEVMTDASGMAVFDALAPGTYTISVSARDYKSESRTIDLTVLGKVEEVHLLPMWAIAAGIVGAGSVGLVVASKLRKR